MEEAQDILYCRQSDHTDQDSLYGFLPVVKLATTDGVFSSKGMRYFKNKATTLGLSLDKVLQFY